jgi:hypothetical protein
MRLAIGTAGSYQEATDSNPLRGIQSGWAMALSGIEGKNRKDNPVFR